MSIKMTDVFNAVDDNGKTYFIEEHSTEIWADLLSGRSFVGYGTRAYFLSDGRAVNLVKEDVFELPTSGLRLKRVR